MESTANTPSAADIDGATPTELRRRADHLVRLAAEIEQSLVMSLADNTSESNWHTRRARLCDAMLERNLHQLHHAADDLRMTAFRFFERADDLDARAAA